MKDNPRIDKIITGVLFAGLFLGLVFVYFAQERLSLRILFGAGFSLGPEKYIRIGSVILIFLSVLLAVFRAKEKYLIQIYLAYILLLAYVFGVYVLGGGSLTNTTDLMDIKGPGPWICLGLIFVSYNELRFKWFQYFLAIAVIVIALMGIYTFLDFGIGSYRGQALAKYRVYAVTMVWITPYVFLSLKTHKTLAKYRGLALVAGISLALIIQTRSFLLIYFLVLFFDFYHSEKKSLYILSALISAFLFFSVLLSGEFLGGAVDSLGQRGLDDTRTEQLRAFFSQLDFFEVIVGKGSDATWNFGGKQYPYLDNQWLLLLWWAGLIPFLAYLYLTAYIPIRMFLRSKDYETKVEAFVLVIWVLACAGLAIYTTMSVDFFFIIICIIQGRLLYKYSLSK
ncbi:hypothetical protein [Spongiimicrobium salis]|uniref:hypothetical protein n=1 Tax=Spongiimicrobium salis TaxID=1667022 RepID=UPI00374DD872